MKITLLILIVLHGLIHLMGFTKAFNLAQVNQLTQNNSKTNGILWLIAAVLFVITAILFFIKNDTWWVYSIAAMVISQYLIFTSWQDAKFGTIANLIILVATVIGYGTWSFRGTYRNDVKTNTEKTSSIPETLLTEADIQNLPESVKKYLRYVGTIGKPKVNNFKVEFTGKIRKDEKSEWMPFTSEQYNFIAASTRLFYLKATMKGLPVEGYHCFKNGDAYMDIRLFSLVKVQYQTGKEMGIAETVTFFNDMCCMAPATLIDKRIKWLDAENNKVKAEFTNNGITILAWLYFNEKGELTNFISEDRYATLADGSLKKLRWATPLKDYKDINGYNIAGYADAVYTYHEGDFIYGTFNTTHVEYNTKNGQ